MNVQQATLLGLGCPDCGGGCSSGLSGDSAGESIFKYLQDFVLTAKSNITLFSKPPGDIFPLINNSVTIETGRYMGRVIDFKVTNEKELWVQVSAVSPGWFFFLVDNVEMRKPEAVAPLTREQQLQIMRDVVKFQYPAQTDVLETVEAGVNVATSLLKYLPWIALTVGGVIVYVKFGDDIKKAFSKPEKKALSGTKKTSKKVIHI